jgi:menaquinone-dependent protoporphyrinogen oxidase
MPRVQVVFASRHAGTAGIARRIAAVLEGEGAQVTLADAATSPDPGGFDAHVIGSGVYIGSWLKEASEFVERNQAILASRPVWFFSSGPIPSASTPIPAEDLMAAAFGPEDGPGSGGRKKIAALASAIQPRDHRVFLGAFDPKDPPKSMQERMVRMLPAVKQALPAGDFREWPVIEAWARQIAEELIEPVPVAGATR